MMTLTNRNYKYFNHAKHVADMSSFTRTPVGCVAVYKNKILSVGFNSHKTSPLQFKYNQYRDFDIDSAKDYVAATHAETSCLSQIRNLDIDWRKVELYVYRKCRSREHGMARPCPACKKMITDIGIKKIFYTGDDSYIYEEIN